MTKIYVIWTTFYVGDVYTQGVLLSVEPDEVENILTTHNAYLRADNTSAAQESAIEDLEELIRAEGKSVTLSDPLDRSGDWKDADYVVLTGEYRY